MGTLSPRLANESLLRALPLGNCGLRGVWLGVAQIDDEGVCRNWELAIVFPRVGAGLEGREDEPRIQDVHPLSLIAGAEAGTGASEGEGGGECSDSAGEPGTSS